MSYRILSERLVVRPFVYEDITDEYLGWLNDRELMRFSRHRLRSHTLRSCEAYLWSFTESANYFWNVETRDGAQVGTIAARPDSVNAVADVGLMIGYPGVGYGTEVLGTTISYLFDYWDARKVTCGTVSTNEAMNRVALRCGMLLEATLREQEPIEDEYVDVLRYGILRPEWLERRSEIVVEVVP